MYGSIFRMKVKAGQEDKVIELFDTWEKTRKPMLKGAIGGLLLKPDEGSGELVAAAIFSDKDSYRANADDPGQHEWFGELRALLEADPEWEDGEFVRFSRD